ncbi:MAG TPA: Type 1 glutamine amidotransferase-like domain-containing protein [Polyangiaceae bacterium]
MTLTLDLVGGGPGAVLAVRRHFKAALDALGRPRPLVAYVGVASDDNRGFFAMIRGGLGAGRARMELAKLASPRASASEARSLLEGCDLVLMSGGDVEHGMKVLHDRDMAGFLVALGRAGKPMFGISAGSLMLAADWVRFPDDDDEAKAELFPCLGLAPLHVDAHSEEDGWSELRVLVRLLHERGDPEPVGYGLTRHGGLHISGDGNETVVRPIGTPIPRFVVRRGKVVQAAALPLPR